MERRTFLALCAAALGLAGCTDDEPLPTPSATPTPSPAPTDPDAATRTAVAESEADLVRAYRAAIAAVPALAAVLSPWLAHHEQHLDRVSPGATVPADPVASSGSEAGASTGAGAGPEAGASPGVRTTAGAEAEATESASPGSGTSPGAEPEATESAAPGPDPGAVLAALFEAERTARRQRVSACDGAVDPGLARDLCLIAASEAQHAAALRDLAEEAG